VNKTYKILLAEDEPTVNRLLQRYLHGMGFLVVAASNGREALDLYRREAPDLLLSDVDMPEMDGLELLSAIHAVDPLLPAILVSGKGDPEEDRGVRDYRFVAKPLNFADLRSHITSAIAC
jgi:CheY-like chemotaxis protein